MTDLVVMTAAFAAVIIVVALCATLRPASAAGLAQVLHALAAVFAAAWPWRRS